MSEAAGGDLDYEQDIRLRKVYAMGVLIGLGVQLAIADTPRRDASDRPGALRAAG